MKKVYEELDLEIIRFETEDVISTSDNVTDEIDPIAGGATGGGT